MSDVEIDSSDVIRVVMQFLRENNLTKSLNSLQEETGVQMNALDNVEALKNEIRHGHWDAVLRTVSQLQLPGDVQIDLYEHIFIELLELSEYGAATSVLRNTDPMVLLRSSDFDRYAALDKLLASETFNAKQAYKGTSKEKRRAQLAQAVCSKINAAPPSRLITMIQQALQFQSHCGLIPEGAKIDILKNIAEVPKIEDAQPPAKLDRKIKFGKESYCNCAIFSPNGQFLVSGTVDGFVEVWNYTTGKLRKDLKYQAEEKIIMMESSIFALAFTNDSQMLASGSEKGRIRVWSIVTGLVLRKFDRAHTKGVTSICFSKDNSKLLSSSFDNTIRLHGLKSGQMLKEFQGHSSYVNDCCFAQGMSRVVSCSSDGAVKVWDAKTTEELTSFGKFELSTAEVTISKIVPLPGSEHFVVCNRSPQLYVVDLAGKMQYRLKQESKTPSDFVTCCTSSQGEYVYGLTVAGQFLCFDTTTRQLVHSFEAHKREPLGILHHPQRNIMASFCDDGLLCLWTP